jgi:hypothetical protein
MLAKSQKSDIVNVVVRWSFHDYVEGGQNPIKNWYDNNLTDAGRFGFDALLKDRAKTANHLEWGLKPLQGEAKKVHIWELKFLADGKQYRVLGVFRAAKQAVLLVGCYHKGKVYTPPNALDTAVERAKALRDKKTGVTTSERKIKIDL